MDPGKCSHPNNALHAGRVDGTRTVCTQCRTTVIITPVQYLSGTSPEAQYTETLQKLDAQWREFMKDAK